MLSKFQDNALAAYEAAQKASSKTFEGMLSEFNLMVPPTSDPVQDTLLGGSWRSVPTRSGEQAQSGQDAVPSADQPEQFEIVPEEQDLPEDVITHKTEQEDALPD